MLLEVDGCIPETAEVCILKILRRVGGQDFEGEVFRKGPNKLCLACGSDVRGGVSLLAVASP